MGGGIGLAFEGEGTIPERLHGVGAGDIDFLYVVEEFLHVGLEGIGVVGEMGEAPVAGPQCLLDQALIFIYFRHFHQTEI